MNTQIPEIPDAAFTLTWRNGAYRVDKPNIGTTKCYTEDQMHEMWRAANARADGVEADAEMFRFLEQHVGGWYTDACELPRIVIKPYFQTKCSGVGSLIVSTRDGVGTVSLRNAIKIIRDAAQAVRSEASEGEEK
jgi:hypothetical protein